MDDIEERSSLSRDLMAIGERRRDEVLAELAEVHAKRNLLDRRLGQLRREQRQLESLLGTYRAGPPAARQRPSRGERRATARDVVELVAAAGRPMHYREIESGLRLRGLDTGGGQDPANALLTRYFRDPRLERVGRGIYQPRAAETLVIEPTQQ